MALNDTPLTGNTLNTTRDLIRDNFLTINSAFQIDCVPYGDPNQGKHAKVTLTSQAMAPLFAAGEMGLFNTAAAPTNRPDIWMSRGLSASFPITGYDNGTISSNNAVSWSYLPSGILMIGGKATTSGGIATINFGITANGGLTSFPGFSSFVTSVIATRIDNVGTDSTVIKVKTFSLTQAVFGLANGSTDSTFFWMAFGL